MTLLTSRSLVAAALITTAGVAGANNNLSDSARTNITASPTIETESATTAVAIGVNQGRASYSVPVVAPPGRAGLEPGLALAYSGSLADGEAGAGWSLGLPRVRVRTSGRGGQPEYGVSVVYQGFSGEDLITIGDAGDVDADGIPDGAYREERDLAFIRYVQRSTGGWLAEFPDGRKLELGTVTRNRIVRAGQATWISEWLPERRFDPSGNELTYTWSTPGDVDATTVSATARFLTEVRYGCRSCATASAYQRVSFGWTRRATSVVDLSAGFVVELELRLATITTATVTGGVPATVRTMTLGYDATGSRPLLTSVAIGAADGTSLPPLTFTYTDGNAPSPVTRTAATVPGVSLKSGVQLFDVDLDGDQDVVDLSAVVGAKWYANTGASAFSPASTAILSPPGRPLATTGTASLDDGNRDSALDVFDLGLSRLYKHNGAAGWSTTGVAAVLPAIAWSTNTLRLDVDSDGHNDLVDTSVNPWVVYLDDGEGNYTQDVVTCTGTTPTFGAALRASSDGVLTGDVNADGKADIVYISTAKTQAFVFYGRGRNCWGWLPEDNHGATTYQTFAITSAVSGPTRNAVSLADVTGDGLDDLVMFDTVAGRVNAWRFSPSGGWSDAGMGGPFVQSITATNGCRISDVDGDSIADAICNTGWKIYDWAAQPVGLLESAANGLGVTAQLRYTTSAAVAAQHAVDGHPWTRNLGTSMTLIAQTETADGRGNVLLTNYDYRNPAIEIDELEDRAQYTGFEYIAASAVPYIEYAPGLRVRDPADPGEMTRTWFDLGLDDEIDWYRHGFAVCTETWPALTEPSSYNCGGATGALSRSESTYTPDPIEATGVFTVPLATRDEYVLEGLASGPQTHTTYAHDDYGNITATVAYGRWDGSANNFGDDEQETTTDYVLDAESWNLRLPKRTTRGAIGVNLEVSYLHYDGAAWDVDTVGLGLRTSLERWTFNPVTGSESTDTVETTSYTSTGLPDLVTDAAGFTNDIDYDTDFGLFKTRHTIDPSGLALSTSYVVEPRTGVVLGVTGPDGNVTSATYDLLGRLTMVVNPGDSAIAPTLTRSYVSGAPVSTITEVRRDGTADGLSSTSIVDGNGKVLCTTKEATANKVDVVTQREYTARGHLAIEWIPTRASGCEVTTLTVAGRGSSRNRDESVFDALGRPTQRTHAPSGTSQRWTYRALERESVDENGNPTVRISDGRKRTTAVTEHLDTNGDGTAEVHTTTYGWTAADQLETVVDPLGATLFAAQYDSRGRQVWSSDPDRGAVTTTWDAVDRIATTTDARSAVVTHAYDAAGRIASVSEAVAGVPGATTTYHYDVPAPGYPAGICRNTRSRMTYVEDATGTTVHCYDIKGNTVRIDKTITALGPAPLRLDRTFDSLDRIKTLTHPDGSRLTWTYGKDGRESKLVLKGAAAANAANINVVSSVIYDGAGKPTQLVLGNGSTLTFGYDRRERPTRFVATTGATLLQDLTLALDGVGNIETITDAAGASLGANYTYDALHRVTSASGDRYGGHTASYEYDLRGNLTSKTSTDAGSAVDIGTITYRTDLVHAVDSARGEVFAYDAGGNLVGDGVRTFAYDARGMLASVSAAGLPAMTNRYDYTLQRTVKDSATGTDVYYFPEAGLEVRGGVAVKSVTFAGQPVLRVAGTFTTVGAAATKARFLVGDHLGGPSLVLDATGTVIERWAGHPHGEDNEAPFVASGHLADFHAAGDPASVLDHRFQGREVNAEDGTYDFGARVYRPDLGRFMTPDTLIPDPEGSQSWNRYSFVRNNPLRFVDPTGHAEVDAAAPSTSFLDGVSVELKNDESGATAMCNVDGCTGKGAAAKDFMPYTIAREGKYWVFEGKDKGWTAKVKIPAEPLGEDVNAILGREVPIFTTAATVKLGETGLNAMLARGAGRAAQFLRGSPSAQRAAFELYSRFAPRGAYILTSRTLSTRGVAGIVSTGVGELAPITVASTVASRATPPLMLYSFLLQGSPSYQQYLQEQEAAAASAAALEKIGAEDFMSAD